MKILAKTIIICAAMICSRAIAAGEIVVYSGCDVPKKIGGGHSFYVDPSKGAPNNDGSFERPWRTLAEVLNPSRRLLADGTSVADSEFSLAKRLPTDQSSQIQPGDTIVLMGGDHGEVTIRNATEGDFVQVVAAIGQLPIVRKLRISQASHWLFRGIKFQGERTYQEFERSPYESLIDLSGDGLNQQTNNIIFDDVSVSSTDDTSNWSPEDWVHRPFATGLKTAAQCTTIANSHFFDLRDAVSVAGDKSVVENNLIERMGNDGIDIMASNLLIRENTIRDGRHSPAEQLHPDGIQGWTLNGKENHDVTIEGNKILNAKEAGDPELQGISIFDGRWNRLQLVNNLVVTNHWHGIALYGVDNATVLNNTVAPAIPVKRPSWITIHESRDNRPSRNVVVRNNIAASFIIDGQNIEFDHNIAQQRIIAHIDGDVPMDLSKGTGRGDNIVDHGILGTFEDFHAAEGKFDMRPSQISRATGAGAENGAPLYDAVNKARMHPIDIGAFSR